MNGTRAVAAALDGVVTAATVAGLVLVATQSVEFGSKAGNWVFLYVAPMSDRIAAVGTLGALGVVVLYEIVRRRIDVRPALMVLLVLAGGFGVQLGVRALNRYTMGQVVVSPDANGFYGAATRTGPLELLRDFDRVSRGLGLHASTNMPGKVLLYQGMRLVTADPNMLAIVIVFLSSLCGLLLYAICRRLFERRTIALDAMALWMLVPSKMGFHPLLNVVTPLPALAAVWAMTRYLDAPGLGWPVVAGALTYATAFFDPHGLWIGVVFAPAIVRAIVIGRTSLGRAAALVAGALAALVAAHAVVRWTTGFDVWRRLLTLVHVFEHGQSMRPYDIWIRVNVKDLVLAAGPAASVTFVAACGLVPWVIGRAVAKQEAMRTIEDAGPGVTVMTLVVIVALLVLGLDRGEVQRLWIFLLAPVGVAVAWCLAWCPARSRWFVMGGTFAYATLTTAMVGYCLDERDRIVEPRDVEPLPNRVEYEAARPPTAHRDVGRALHRGIEGVGRERVPLEHANLARAERREVEHRAVGRDRHSERGREAVVLHAGQRGPPRVVDVLAQVPWQDALPDTTVMRASARSLCTELLPICLAPRRGPRCALRCSTRTACHSPGSPPC